MNEITVTIDGREIRAQEGETILNIARANDIFIPAICYLTRCSPTLACRLCMVDADGKRGYSCNVKAKDGMEIVTSTPEIEDERRKIMQVYDINHPLQCGVCDQNGECELQNYTLEMGVRTQEYGIKDTHKPVENWGHVTYDPSLCIVCERCVTLCQDVIGDNSLKTVPRGGDAVPAEYRDSIPKDVYGIWNKMNKSLIGRADDAGDSVDWAECIAVCPVGALVSTDFQYTSNAWELSRVPSTCAHCSVGCPLYYDVKHESIASPETKIYRVTNDWHFASLCGAGRFGYDFENKNVQKDSAAFASAVKAFKKADTISFTGYVTNEEALILQKLKEKYHYRLISPTTRTFQKFMNAYTGVAGESLYSGTKQDIHESEFIITLGTSVRYDSPVTGFAINNSLKMNKGSVLFYFHPVGDSLIETFSKKTAFVKQHAPLREDVVLTMLLDAFCDKSMLNSPISSHLQSFWEVRQKAVKEKVKETVIETLKERQTDEEGNEVEVEKTVEKEIEKEVETPVDYHYNTLNDKLGLSGDIYEEIREHAKGKQNPVVVLGADLFDHPQAEYLASLAGLLQKRSSIKVVIIPPETNSLGVSKICDLDDTPGDYTIGYNLKGDFTLSAMGEGDLDMPALNQQEGTFVNLDKRVVPLNVASPYHGYTLNDIASELGIRKKYTIRYTELLPEEKGFRAYPFDELRDGFLNSGEEIRGYVLDSVVTTMQMVEPQPINEQVMEETLAYSRNPSAHFSPFSNRAHELTSEESVAVSQAFLEENVLSEGDMLELAIEGKTLRRRVVADPRLSGNVLAISGYTSFDEYGAVFESGYRFKSVTFRKA